MSALLHRVAQNTVCDSLHFYPIFSQEKILLMMFVKFPFYFAHLRKSASLIFVFLCHGLIFLLFIHSTRPEHTTPVHALMTIFSVDERVHNPLSVSLGEKEMKISHDIAGQKNVAIEAVKIESKIDMDSTTLEQFPMEKAKSEGNPISSKELASLDSLASRYKLDMPKAPLVDALTPALTPAQQAAQDPRTNSARLTKSEQFAVALGSLDCIFQTRLADGKIIRVSGQWVVGPARSEAGMKTLAKSRFCVRFHQEADEDGNDLMAISAGIKGKL